MEFDFAGKRVLVTGATGFIGSWLTEKLIDSGADVSVLINKDGPLGLGGISDFIKKVKPFYGDITKIETIKPALTDQEIVFHLAALTQVIHSFTMAKKFLDVNATGTTNILDELRNSKSLELFVYASTDKVCGEPKYLPVDEEHTLSAKSPYDASKLAGDVMTSAYHSTFGLPTTITRWSNTIGGRDSNILRAVPDFVTSIMNKKPPTIRGDGKQVRDYIYVTDSVSGILAAADKIKKANGEVFHLGTERPSSVLEIANLVIEKMGMKGKMKPVVLGKNNPGEIDKQYLSSKKAREVLGWKPEVSLEEGVEKSVDWYKSHPEWYDLMMRVKKYWDSQ
jgi:CDP-glucose 4,6-dehydratase